MNGAKRVIGLVTLIAGIIILTSCRHPFYHGNSDQRFDWFAEKLIDYLDMDENQQKVLMSKKDDYLKETYELHKKRMDLMTTLSAQVRSEKFDTASIEKALNEQNKMEERMESLFLNSAVEIHKILRPDQRIKLADKLDQILQEHHNYRME